MRVALALVLCGLLAAHGTRRKSLSPDGAIAACVIGLLTFTNGNWGVSSTLLVFYLSSSRLTKYGHDRKVKLEDGHAEGGQRDAIQVFSNGFTGAALSALYIVTCSDSVRSFMEEVFQGKRLLADCDGQWRTMLLVAYVSHYACCNADTWSSELGILAKRPPRLITAPWRSVPPGTNGGVTLMGLSASLGGGLAVGATMALSFLAQSAFTPSIVATESGSQWSMVLFWVAVGGVTGVFGSVLDSVFGATLQMSLYDGDRKKVVDARKLRGRKKSDLRHISGVDVLDNNQVNFLSSLVTAVAAGMLYQLYVLSANT
ncbi:hypothetical protein M427DRAFT_57688 [Gonapodya prolifera JEL478]|uniref:DUF92-domain-containing protein n=1 Tax=Gonapodya prolifera (strain JEL478) TaxID=1344416 RepID=A0A139ABN8_GONPJ|nr:hypothetical protein M427DRAFT_57688 [Gonapodya prolifera JEL478]|eukprot:KXS14226.1 hypothetical protein M427DRAFT_57688 [Gonapodya prolifera JEL478]